MVLPDVNGSESSNNQTYTGPPHSTQPVKTKVQQFITTHQLKLAGEKSEPHSNQQTNQRNEAFNNRNMPLGSAPVADTKIVKL